MPRKLTAKTRALRRFKRSETKAGQKQDKKRKAPVVGIKDYDPQTTDYPGVDTPKKRISKKKSASKSSSCTPKRKPSAWNLHVKKTMKANPNCAFSEVLKKASASYKSKKC